MQPTSIKRLQNILQGDDAIKKTAKFLQPKTVHIVTYNEEEVIEEDGLRVEVVPIFKWMMR